MGGCVSSPKDLALNEGEAPVETPTSPKNVETETVAQEKTQEGGDEKTEEPLVDLCEPKEEAKPEDAVAATETTEKALVEEPKAEEKKEEPLVTL